MAAYDEVKIVDTMPANASVFVSTRVGGTMKRYNLSGSAVGFSPCLSVAGNAFVDGVREVLGTGG